MYSVRQIKASYNAKADDDSIICRMVFRPLSFYLTCLMLNAGIRRPNHATLIAFIFGLAAMTFFITGVKGLFWMGAVSYITYMILDYVDGNIARVTGSATYLGKYLDGAVDSVVMSLAPVFLTLGYYFRNREDAVLVGGIVLSLLYLGSFFLMNRTSFYTRMVKLDVMDGKAANPSSVERDVNILKANAIPLREIINFTVDMRTIILVTASFLGMTGWLLGLFMAAVVLCGAAIIAVSLTEAFAQLDISKISRLAVKEGVPPAAHFAQSQGVKR